MKKIRFAVIPAAIVLCTAMLSGCSTVKDNTVFSQDDLPGKTIGVQLGTTGDDIATTLEKEPAEGTDPATVERYNKGADAVNALKLGKIDCVIIDNEPAKEFVSRNDDLQILPDNYGEEEYAIAVKLDNDTLLSELNGAIEELKADGTIDQILSNYIGDNTGSFKYESPSDVDRSKGKLVMATNAEFPPYEYREGDDIIGIDPDIMQAICDKLGYELTIENMDFEAIIPAIQSGKANLGMAGITVNADRLKNVNFTDSYATGLQVIITRKK